MDDTTDRQFDLELLRKVIEACQELASAIEQVEARVRIVEQKSYQISEWERIMLDLGFKQ